MSSSGDHSDPAGLFGSCTEGPHLWSAVPLMIAVAFVEIPDRSYRDHETVALTPHERAVSAAGPSTPRQSAAPAPKSHRFHSHRTARPSQAVGLLGATCSTQPCSGGLRGKPCETRWCLRIEPQEWPGRWPPGRQRRRERGTAGTGDGGKAARTEHGHAVRRPARSHAHGNESLRRRVALADRAHLSYCLTTTSSSYTAVVKL